MDDLALSLVRPISNERLLSYGDDTDSLETRLLLYFWNVELSQSLYPLFQAFEVAFRNTIHQTLADHLDDDRWFENPDVVLENQMVRVVDAQRTLADRRKEPTTGRMVAQLTFGFWTSMFNRPYEESLWYDGEPILLTRAFPHLPKHKRTRKSVYGGAQLANTLRNRIFHFEPIWNRPRLLVEHDRIVEMLGWISPELGDIVSFYDQFEAIYARGPGYPSAALARHLNLE